ncbi:uncharacterized protein LOC127837243 isoform X2 [Dreissena polymorpha]|uniref:uncharacterized protein LOC127837243 isoform X2 n=1 Tax=Dreissena polymorpha TaxID=45954 RepID=UPI002263D707|nr:uncharacterized protein LOC127837243 isoform X2 [Dreissena polymorpha]
MSSRFEQFLKFCKGHSPNTEILKLANKRFLEADKYYIDSAEFLSLVDSTENKIATESARFFVHLRDFLTVLKDHKAENVECSVHHSGLDGGNSDSDTAFVSTIGLSNSRIRSNSRDSEDSRKHDVICKVDFGKKRNKCDESDSDTSLHQEVKRKRFEKKKRLEKDKREASEDADNDSYVAEEFGNNDVEYESDVEEEYGNTWVDTEKPWRQNSKTYTHAISRKNEITILRKKCNEDLEENISNYSFDADVDEVDSLDADVDKVHSVDADDKVDSVDVDVDKVDSLDEDVDTVDSVNSCVDKDHFNVDECQGLQNNTNDDVIGGQTFAVEHTNDSNDCEGDADVHSMKRNVTESEDKEVIDCDQLTSSPVSLPSLSQGSLCSENDISDKLPPSHIEPRLSLKCVENPDIITDEHAFLSDSNNIPGTDNESVCSGISINSIKENSSCLVELELQEKDEEAENVYSSSDDVSLSNHCKTSKKDVFETVTLEEELEPEETQTSENSKAQNVDTLSEESPSESNIEKVYEETDIVIIDSQRNYCYVMDQVNKDQNKMAVKIDMKNNSESEQISYHSENQDIIMRSEEIGGENRKGDDRLKENNKGSNIEERFEVLESDEENKSIVIIETPKALSDKAEDVIKTNNAKCEKENHKDNSDDEIVIASVEKEVMSIKIKKSSARTGHWKVLDKDPCTSMPKSAKKSLNFYASSSDEEDPDYAEKARKFREKQKKRYKISVGKKNKRTGEAEASIKKGGPVKRLGFGLFKQRKKEHDLIPFGKAQHNNEKRCLPKSPKKSPAKSPALLILTDSDSDEFKEMNVEQLKKKVEKRQDQELKEMFNIVNEAVILVEKIAITVEVKKEIDVDEAPLTAEDLDVKEDQDEKCNFSYSINTSDNKEDDGIDDSRPCKEKKRAKLFTLSKSPNSNKSVPKAFVEDDKAWASNEESDEDEKVQDTNDEGDQEHLTMKDKNVGKTNDDEQPGPSDGNKEQVKKGSSRQIRKLEALLQNIRDEIERVRSRELSLDDLESEVSDYLLEDKLQHKFVKVYNKLCELHEAKSYTGRPTEKYFRYQGTRYEAVNRKIERFVNKRKVFPDYHDIRNLIVNVNKDKRLNLRARDIDDLAREAFTDVGNQLQKRRQKDFVSSLHFPGSEVNPYSTYDDPALFDPDLKKKLDHNKKTGKTKMDQVVEKYAHLQYEVGDKTDNEGDDDEEESEGVVDLEEPIPGVDCSDNEGDSRDGLPFVPGISSESTMKHVDQDQQKYGIDICITAGKGVKQGSPSLEIENLESGETKSFRKQSQKSTVEDKQMDYFSENLGLKRKADVLELNLDEDNDAKRVKLDMVGGTLSELDIGKNPDVVDDAKIAAEKSKSSILEIHSEDEGDSEDFAFEVIENSDCEAIESYEDTSSPVNEKNVQKESDWTDIIKATSSMASEDTHEESNSENIKKEKDFLRLESVEILPDKIDLHDNIGNSCELNKVDIDLKGDKNQVHVEKTVILQTEDMKTNMDKTSDDTGAVESVTKGSKIENKSKASHGIVSEKESAIPKSKPEVNIIGEIDLTDDTDVIAIPSDDEDTIHNTNNPMKIKIVSACSIKSKNIAGVKDATNVMTKSKMKTPRKSRSVNVPQFQNSAIENLNRVMKEKWHEEPCKQTLNKALVNSKHYINSSSNVSNQLTKLQNNMSKSPNLAFQCQGSKFKGQVQTSTPEGLHTTVPVHNLLPSGCNVSPVKGQISSLQSQILALNGQKSPFPISKFQGQRFPLKGQGLPLKDQASPLIHIRPVGSQVSTTKFSWETTKISPSAASTMIANTIMQKNASLKSRHQVDIENKAALCKKSNLSAPLQGAKPLGFTGNPVNTFSANQKVTPQLGVRGSVPHGMGRQQNRNGMKTATNSVVGSGNNHGSRVLAPAQQPFKTAKPVSKFNIPLKPLVPDVILIDADDKSVTIDALDDVVVVSDSSISNSNLEEPSVTNCKRAINSKSDSIKLKKNNSGKDTVVQLKVDDINASDQSKKGTENETQGSCQTERDSLESVADIYNDIKSPPVQETDFVVELNVEFDESDSDSESLLDKEIKTENVDNETLGGISSVCLEQTKYVNDERTTQVLNHQSVKCLDVDISKKVRFTSPSDKLCDNSTNYYGIEEISSTSYDIDHVRQRKMKSDKILQNVKVKKTIDTKIKSQPLQTFTANKGSPISKKVKRSNCLWSDDENAGIIESYQEPDSTPYSLEENTISSSGHVIVLSDSE